jgi:hypothetical protein
MRSRAFRSRSRQTQSAVERLEDRTLLTGNVVAQTLAGGDLRIRGDFDDNQIVVRATATGVEVASLDGTTTINDGLGPFAQDNPVRNVFIDMNGGDDVVHFGDDNLHLSITRNLVIDGGWGDDTIQVLNATIGGDACLSGGWGEDHVQVGFDAGLGIIGVDETLTGHVEVGRSLKIKTDGGQDHIAVVDTNVGRDLTIKSDGRDDEILIGAARVPAEDSVPLSDLVFGHVAVTGDVKVKTGCGDDTVIAVDLTVGGDTKVETGAGDDHIAILDSNATFGGDLTIDSGRGHDAIVMVFSAVLRRMKVDAGCGDDCIWLAADLFQQQVKVDGGGGSDTFFQSESVFPNTYNGGPPVLKSIETETPNALPTDQEIIDCFDWVLDLLNGGVVL